MKLKTTTLMAATLSSFVMFASGAPAQETLIQEVAFEVNDGAAAHVSLSGKLQMLSQQVSASTCQVVRGYDVEYASSILQQAVTEFETIVDALEFGDPALGIPHAEERRITLAALADVRTEWAPLKILVDHALAGQATEDELSQELEVSSRLLSATKVLGTQEIAEYSNPTAMAAAESFLIDIAGRQRLLIQMMVLDSCLALYQDTDEESLAALATSMSTFETTLGALQNGLPSVGIRRPPTAAIGEGLVQVASEFEEIRPFLEQTLAGELPDFEAATEQFRSLNEMMETMSSVVELYVAAVDV